MKLPNGQDCDEAAWARSSSGIAPAAFEVEFADADGQTVAMVTLPGTALLRLS